MFEFRQFIYRKALLFMAQVLVMIFAYNTKSGPRVPAGFLYRRIEKRHFAKRRLSSYNKGT
jgi:hypothetical protein